MIKHHFGLNVLILIFVGLSGFITGLLISNFIHIGVYKQSNMQIYDAKSKINSENLEGTNSVNTLQLKGLNGEKKPFMIDSFRNIYRVQA